MQNRKWIFGVVVLFLLSLANFAQADDVRTMKKKSAPQMASMGIFSMKHSCAIEYGTCMQRCKAAESATCVMECETDCSVCAMDFGEEASRVCER